MRPEGEEGPQEGRSMLEGSKAVSNTDGRKLDTQDRKRFGEGTT